MVTFAVPEYQSVAHFALGVLLDRASLGRVGYDGRHQLTVSLLHEDVTLLQEMGVIHGDCDQYEAGSPETENWATVGSEFERELIELQQKVEASLAKACLSHGELS